MSNELVPKKLRTAPPKPTGYAALTDLLRGAKGFIIWAGASVAGITAILYATGYLVARAHLSMLGLYGFVDFSNDFYLQEGAKFLVTVSFTIARYAIVIVAFAGVVYIAVWLLGGLFKRVTKKPLLPAGWRVPANPRTLERLRRGAYALLLVALLMLQDHSLGPLEAPLGVKNLLYVDRSALAAPVVETTRIDDSNGLKALILTDKKAALVGAFQNLLGMVCAAAGLTIVAWRVVQPWKPRAWLILPYVVALALGLLALPMDYGVLMRATLYPRVTLTPDGDQPFPMADRAFLLSATKDAFVIWDSLCHRLAWIPSDRIAFARSDDVADLFGPVTRPVATSGGCK
ncbi:hypothetical protein [Burkholderia ubonensis]|uniref:hypothetical protein n=1 Tax=Burkholderia ubonensis TaxID=101571 RepID=UPI000B21AE6E|nr:hypothetical protein [Burkholderia ubonensis]